MIKYFKRLFSKEVKENKIPEIQETDNGIIIQMRDILSILDEQLKSLEWGRMTVLKNQRIDEMMEECLKLMWKLLICKDK